MTKVANAKLEESSQNRSLFSGVNRENSSGGIIQSVMGFFFGNDNASSSNSNNNTEDYPYQGIFTHLDSANSVNRNGSSLSSNSVLFNEYKNELKDNYLNNMNEPVTNPFSSNLSEEEKRILVEVDKEIKASLSINSNKGSNEEKKN
ncbi:hypothetical protein BCR36DRAFT_399850 [Piromyces finnis]|uniref:Uncharacterized protein n=1 Tax=Piromyces finnis TaxID=1754191 RepID=A0A1Y1V1B6_9FUNG|nr:hypothetical protein BCR36DRAFT_399850 [Piromyces finnis]|eukprot:ORX43808.1 hypothetical protein BCR36DRAFT_399850 [Piromyces finnis]